MLAGVETWDPSTHILEVAKKAAPPKDHLTEYIKAYIFRISVTAVRLVNKETFPRIQFD